VGGAGIPGFDIDKMRTLRCTVGEGDAFRPVMACHYSPEGGESPCVGYLAVHGYSNLSVRMMAMRGEVDLPAVVDACELLDLWPSFDEMLDAYESA
jgi:hypothetical protein